MKRKITILMTLLIILLASKSQAGLEIKSGTSSYANVNVSESFELCYNLRENTSTLGTNNLDPHLATALDWGAVAYLAQSRYGRNNSSVSANTTGNQSGIMNMNSYTQIATMSESRNTVSTNATQYRKKLEEAVNDPTLSKYVLIIPNKTTKENTRGMAMQETYHWYAASTYFDRDNNADNCLQIRDSLFGAFVVLSLNTGGPYPNVTFRPTIWN